VKYELGFYIPEDDILERLDVCDDGIIFISSSGVESSLVLQWPLVPAPDDDDDDDECGASQWNDWQEKPKLKERTCPSTALSITTLRYINTVILFRGNYLDFCSYFEYRPLLIETQISDRALHSVFRRRILSLSQ
jgi:hypothetical protein